MRDLAAHTNNNEFFEEDASVFPTRLVLHLSEHTEHSIEQYTGMYTHYS